MQRTTGSSPHPHPAATVADQHSSKTEFLYPPLLLLLSFRPSVVGHRPGSQYQSHKEEKEDAQDKTSIAIDRYWGHGNRTNYLLPPVRPPLKPIPQCAGFVLLLIRKDKRKPNQPTKPPTTTGWLAAHSFLLAPKSDQGTWRGSIKLSPAKCVQSTVDYKESVRVSQHSD